MGKKKKKQSVIIKFFNFWVWTFIRATLLIVRNIPAGWIVPIGSAMGKLFYYLPVKHKQRGLKNLQIAFGQEKSANERKHIFKQSLANIGKNFLEVTSSLGFSLAKIKENIELVGKENLARALDEKKGVIALSAHLGNFMLIGPRLIAEGYSFSVIARDPKDQRIAKLFRNIRQTLGIDSIPDKPKKECIARSLNCLRSNGILFLQIDQSASSDDPWVDFFGWLVPTFKGPVIFSIRIGTPVLPFFMVRKPDNKLKLIIGPKILLEKAENKEEEIKKNVALLTKVTEGYVREYPEQWWWLHRRWKKAKKIEKHRISNLATPPSFSAMPVKRDPQTTL